MSSSRTDAGRAASTLVDVTMPQMGVSVAEGTVVAWRVGPGDSITADETICEISTDKIDTEVPAPVSGVVAEIVVPVETTVEVGTVLARIAPRDGVAVAAPGDGEAPRRPEMGCPPGHACPRRRRAGGRRTGPPPATVPVAATPRWCFESRPSMALTCHRWRAPAGPAGCASTTCSRSWRRSRQPPLHIESPYRPEPAPAVGAEELAGGGLSRMRRQIGAHMKRSLDEAAHCTTWIEVDMGRVETARAGLRVTALSFVARAAIAALREHPSLNAWLEGDRYTQHEDVNLGIAVSLGEDGLIVPVIHRAHELSVEGLAARISDLARRARARELTADDVRGGTFTITNPGQYGSIMATPIINQPQVAILDLEAVVKRPVVVTDADGNDSIAIRPMTILGLSWDHRALDGAVSAQFLATVKRHLEGLTGA